MFNQAVHPPIGLIIADEGHRLKSIEAKTTKALRSLKTQRRVVLSGTPIQNNLQEYYAMVDFVNPGILSDFKTFKKTYEQPILRSREPGASLAQKTLGQSRADELAELSQNYILRRGSDVIAHHLPPRHDYCLFIALTKAQRKIYASILATPEIRAVFSGEVSQRLVLINTLRKLCNVCSHLLLPLVLLTHPCATTFNASKVCRFTHGRRFDPKPSRKLVVLISSMGNTQ